MFCMLAKNLADCLRLSPITELRGCCVGVQVLDCRGSEPGILQWAFHYAANTSTILWWSICVKGVGIRGVTNNLRQHLGSSR